MDKEQLKKDLPEGIVRFDQTIKTSIAVPTKAEVLIEPRRFEDLLVALQRCRDYGVTPLILGLGANVILSKDSYPLIIRPKNDDITLQGNTVVVGAGANLAQVANETAKAGLKGLEWLIAVPGRIGGAVYGNAGAFGGEVKDTLVSAVVFDGAIVQTLTNKQMDFSYRSSVLKKRREAGQADWTLLSAAFELEPADPELINAVVKRIKTEKWASQPMGESSAGCTFKNIEFNPDGTLRFEHQGVPNNQLFVDAKEFIDSGKIPVGWLLDHMGLKGLEHDGFMISPKHANFIVHTSREGSYAGWRGLVDKVKDRVKQRYGIILEEEVQIM